LINIAIVDIFKVYSFSNNLDDSAPAHLNTKNTYLS